jgi:hypothetical protein
MDNSITVETDIFEHREVKPHFINPCCFGEDFAAWLKQQLSPLADSGFTFSELIQEDYGWGFWTSHGRDRYWLAISYVGNGPQEPPAQWVVSVIYEPGLNPIKRLFYKPDAQVSAQLKDRIWQSLRTNNAIVTVDTSKRPAASG